MTGDWMPGAGRPGGRPPLIGVTGPIGCGKSTVARMLGDLGGTVIDADDLARHVTQPGSPALTRIRARFGEGAFDERGDLNRAALARIVFDDETALRELEAIVHPEVRVLVESELDRAAAAHAPFAVVEAIKLVEGGLGERCDEIWLIDCLPATQRQRLEQRGSDPADLERRLAAQGPGLADRLAARIAPAGKARRLSTESYLDETRRTVEEALADFLARTLDMG